ncbi:hypothetical protein ACFSTH_11820 [Paenibacillus yanchengensis]|uniref:Helicase ATP-binding domain-containing protein n=1 Tax=Paenibacillus yanchengensis TaxID=2035833 RepID=A0ABW4YQY6_9BACL
MYISEKIKDEYKHWKQGDIIFIDAGTGSGKSHFIRNELSDFAESNFDQILLLVNRIELKKQIDALLESQNNKAIKTITYQTIEHNKEFDFRPYKYIVCDECHYFTEDSPFNFESDVSLKLIKGLNDHIRVFMSATGGTIFNHLEITRKIKPYKYRIKRDFSNILSLSFYNYKESTEPVERFIKEQFSNSTDKIIWFCRSLEQAEKLHNKYSDSSFMCSRSQKGYIHLITKDMIIDDGDKITFKGKWLFTTNVLDNGFDFKDDNIKLIICDYPDINSVLQCIGRKRKLHDKDNVHIVLADHNNQAISGFVRDRKEALKQAQYIIDGKLGEYFKIAGKFSDKSKYIVMDVLESDGKDYHKKVSYPKFLKVKSDYEMYSHIQSDQADLNKFRVLNGEKKRNDGFKQYISAELKQAKFYDLDEIYGRYNLSEYLAELVDIKLFKAEQKDLINRIDYRADGKQFKSYSALNDALKQLKLNYVISSRVETKGENRNKRYWIINKITD